MLNYLLEVSTLFANRVVAAIVMVVDTLVSKLRSNTTRIRPLGQTVAVVDQCTIVVAVLVPEVDPVDIADLFANRVGANVVLAVVEVAVEHSKGTPTDTILKGVNTCTIVVAELVPESEYAAKLLA